MTIAFPKIEHVDDLMPALRGREDLETMFITREFAGFLAVNYILMIPGAFGCLVNDPDPRPAMLRREARGIKFDPASGRVIARPHPKFFNLGQEPETQLDQLPWRRPFRVLEKLDGSMVHPTPVDGQILYTTRMGTMPDPAIRAHIAAHEGDYAGFCAAMLADGYTPIFEWCAPDPASRIVLYYPQPKLILTAIRHTVDGTMVDHEAMHLEAARWGVPVVATWETNVVDIDAYVADLSQRTGIEGVVFLWDETGYAVKAKTEEYRRNHQFLEDIQREDKALEMVLHGQEDDVLAVLNGPDERALRDYAGRVNRALAAKIAWAETTAQTYGHDRKTFATEISRDLDKADRVLALNTMNRGDARKQVMNLLIEPQNGTVKSVDTARAWLDLPSWHDLRRAHV